MTISFSGLASGLDTSSWVDSLVSLKKAKATSLEKEKSNLEYTRDAVNEIKSFFTNFRSALEKVTDAKLEISSVDSYNNKRPKHEASTDLDVLTAAASTDAEEGSYNITVEQLASYTAAYSDYSSKTTYTKTDTASGSSTLTSLGANIDGAAQIGIYVNGIERELTLSEFETIDSFINKLNDIGVDASFNEQSGTFSVNLDLSDINDISNCGIVDALNLARVNEGYQSKIWQTEETDTITQTATSSTKLSALGTGQNISGSVTVKNSSGEE